MKKDLWILHVDLVSYDPKHVDKEASVNLQIIYDTEKEMNQAYMQFHSSIGDPVTIDGRYTILAVEPSLYPVSTDADERSSVCRQSP